MYQDYLKAKYGSDSPGSDRFKRQVGEYHASQISACQRKLYWAFDKGTTTDESSFKYFELGRLHEKNFGAALAWKYGNLSKQQLNDLNAEELVEVTPRVQQDVEFEIDMGDYKLVGESDWVVFEEDATPIAKVYVTDAERRAVTNDGDGIPYENNVELVFETKTTKTLDWKHKYGHDEAHRYQLAAYMHAFDSPGEIVYIERDTLALIRFPFDNDSDFWLDCKIRLQTHHDNLTDGSLPSTTPLSDFECKYCSFKKECQAAGGSVWS